MISPGSSEHPATLQSSGEIATERASPPASQNYKLPNEITQIKDKFDLARQIAGFDARVREVCVAGPKNPFVTADCVEVSEATAYVTSNETSLWQSNGKPVPTGMPSSGLLATLRAAAEQHLLGLRIEAPTVRSYKAYVELKARRADYDMYSAWPMAVALASTTIDSNAKLGHRLTVSDLIAGMDLAMKQLGRLTTSPQLRGLVIDSFSLVSVHIRAKARQ